MNGASSIVASREASSAFSWLRPFGRTREREASSPASTQRTVVILCPGGLEHGGGIGRMMGYFLNAPGAWGHPLDYRVVDTRGPWFLGGARGRLFASLAYFMSSLATLMALRLRRKPSLLHVNVTGRGSTIRKTILCALASVLGLPYLLHVHDPDYLPGFLRLRRLLRLLVRSMFRHAQTVIVLGARDRERFIEGLRLPADQVQVVPNAVPDPGPRIERRDPVQPCNILFLGHLSERKGVPELLAALATPEVAGRSWRAVLAGGGPRNHFQGLARDLGIAERITFPGWLGQQEVSQLYADADILVLPSHAEGLAMAVLEALSHAIPVITTPVGAHEEVIEPGVSGLFVPPGEVSALAVALTRLINDPDERSRLGSGGRRRFEERFDAAGYKQTLNRVHWNHFTTLGGAGS